MDHSTRQQRLWIDTDCGIDDALALLVCLASPTTEVVGISASFGNVEQSAVITNVLRVLRVAAAAGRPADPIPVYLGASGPIHANDVHSSCSWVHGNDGLGDVPEIDGELNLTKPLANLAGDECAALKHLSDCCDQGPVDVLLLGPATFLAHALNAHPDIKSRINAVYVMGGAFPALFGHCKEPEHQHMTFCGNMADVGMPNAEHNVACCPHSLQTILDAIDNVIFIDWALTCVQPWLWADYDHAMASGLVGKWYGAVTAKLAKQEKEWQADGFLVCDPLAAAVCVAGAEIISGRERGNVTVNCGQDREILGQTTIALSSDGPHHVVTGVDYNAINKVLTRACSD